MSNKSHAAVLNRRTFLGNAAALGAAALVATRFPAPIAGAATEATDAAFTSALFAARAIRRKDISSAELTDHILGRIAAHNPRINAIVVHLHDEARQRAKAADEALAKGRLWGPFHGVPITIKETYAMEGLPTTAGAPELKDYRPAEDATAVQRLRQAGAVILGKTNVPLMAQDIQSYNEIYGTTNNPWDLERTPGGSTGGGAAALAAGLSFLSLGSDIGGSIRHPANFCGVYGHKPTIAVIPKTGHIPPPPSDMPPPPENLSVAGPLARSAADLKAAMEVLGGPGGPEGRAYTWKMPHARGTRLKDYRIGYVLDDPFCPVTAEVREQLEACVEALGKAGVRVEQGWPQGVDPKDQLETYLWLLIATLPPLPPPPAGSTPPPADLSSVNVMQIAARASMANSRQFKEYTSKQVAAQNLWQNYFKTHDAFLMPVNFVPAFPHDHSESFITRTLATPEGVRSYNDLLYWISFATLTGCPATSAPIGLTAGTKLPVGVQIMGPLYEDATTIDIAGKLGDILGGFQPPPGFDS